MPKLIGSVSASAGWRAVYENMTGGHLEGLPVAYWNQVERAEVVETVGVVLTPNHDGFVQADQPDPEQMKGFKLVGYAAPGEPLTRWKAAFEDKWTKEKTRRTEEERQSA